LTIYIYIYIFYLYIFQGQIRFALFICKYSRVQFFLDTFRSNNQNKCVPHYTVIPLTQTTISIAYQQLQGQLLEKCSIIWIIVNMINTKRFCSCSHKTPRIIRLLIALYEKIRCFVIVVKYTNIETFVHEKNKQNW
jgi:hypothetical protein